MSGTDVSAGVGFQLTSPGTDQTLCADQTPRTDETRWADGSTLVDDGGRRYECVDGVWDFIVDSRRDAIERFATDYAAVRSAEARTPRSADAVRALPYADLSGELVDMWAQRAQSFDRFLDRLGSRTGAETGTVVDLGAGCGWLAARLAAAGWTAAAVDITVDGGDGLAAARWHDHDLFLARAEMDLLPFQTGSVDLVVFNASLHYAPDMATTLTEAARVTRPGGRIVIMDSPVFTDPAAGVAMVAEFAAATTAAHGVTPATLFGPGFVTEADLDRFVTHHRPAQVTRIDDRHGPMGAIRSRLGARRAGREIAKRPLLMFTTRSEDDR